VLTESVGATLTMESRHGRVVRIIGRSGVFVNEGTLLAGGDGRDKFFTGFVNAGSGLASVTSGTLAFLGALTNNGTLEAEDGVLRAKEIVTGTGMLDIGGSGTLWLNAGSDAGQTVDFLAGSGVLELGVAADFAGLIENFVQGDQIELRATTETGWSFANNTLTVMEGHRIVAALHFAAGYTQSDFSVSQSGTMVVITHS